jgi:dTDP-4-dehydrorhamnose reductase
MRVIVIGAGGQLGAAITQEFAGHDVLAFTRRDLDITDARRILTLTRCRPDVIVNCAAYNAVDAAEDHPELAMAVNNHAVRTLAKAADAAGAVFVHYSSDFVFDGESQRPYDERDPPNPIGAYGRSKAAGERSAASAGRHYVLRLASVFGGRAGEGRGGNTTIDRMLVQMRAGDDVQAFSDRTVTPSYTYDVAHATRRLVDAAAPFGVYHCVASEPTTWTNLAREIAVILASPSRVRSIPAAAAPPTRARRPQHCALSNARLAALGVVMPAWQDALARHIQKMSLTKEPA